MTIKFDIRKLSVQVLCLYFLLLPIDAALGNIIGSISLINYIAIFYSALRLIYIFLIDKKINISNLKKNIFVVLYTLYFALSIFFRQSQMFNSFFVFSLLISFIVFLLAVTDNYTMQDMNKIKKSIFFSVFSILFAVIFMSDYLSEAGRLVFNSDKTMDPNFFAIGLVLLSSLLTNNIIYNNKRTLNIIALIFLFVVIILTGSRSGLIANLFIVVMSFFFSNVSKGKKIKFAIIFLFLSILFLSNIGRIVPEKILNRFNSEYTLNDSGAGRFVIWENAMTIYSENNVFREIFGTGAGTLQYIELNKKHAAHNVYVQTIFEGGILNFLIYIAFIMKSLIYSLKSKNYIAFLALVGLSIGAFGVDINISRIFWMCIFLVYCNRNITSNLLILGGKNE